MNRWFAWSFAGFLVAGVATAPAADSPQTQFINEQIVAGYKAADIKKPAPRASDAEFLRRVFIDLIGRIATPEEVVDFEQDKSSDKREKLVNRLLNSTKYTPKINGKPVMSGKEPLTFDYADEYSKHWANIWTVWLQSRSGHPGYRDQMNFWLYDKVFSKNMSYKDMVTELITATGKSNENGAVNFIAHQLGEKTPDGRGDELGHFDNVPITSRSVRLFLGVRIGCSQCHEHPFFKEWVQTDFWGVNAFFRQTTRDGTPTPPPGMRNNNQPAGLAVLTLSDNAGVNSNGPIYWEYRNGKLGASKPAFLKDQKAVLEELASNPTKMSISTKTMSTLPAAKTRREAFAQFLGNHDMFAKAYVNRMWGHFFGRGLNKNASVDDFGSENELVHPELLERLGRDFAQYNYDSKMLIQWICNSDVYQLSHVASKEYVDPKYEPYFARMPLKALSPEVLFESIMTATKADESPNSEQKKTLRDQWMNKLVRNFGDDEGNEVTFNGTIIQALLMMNGREINDEISAKGTSAVARVVMKHSPKGGSPNVDLVLDELFLMTVNRHPTNEEKVKLKAVQTRGVVLKEETPKPGTTPKTPTPPPPPPKGKGPNRPMPMAQPATPSFVPPVNFGDPASQIAFYEDVFWALLNTNEFMLNH